MAETGGDVGGCEVVRVLDELFEENFEGVWGELLVWHDCGLRERDDGKGLKQAVSTFIASRRRADSSSRHFAIERGGKFQEMVDESCARRSSCEFQHFIVSKDPAPSNSWSKRDFEIRKGSHPALEDSMSLRIGFDLG
jgi:hypothetical protein